MSLRMMLLFGLLVWIWRRPPRRVVPVANHMRNTARAARGTFKELGLQAKLKIAVSFYQIATLLDSTYDVRLPAIYTQWTAAFNWLGVFDWSDLALPSQCLATEYTDLLTIKAVGPLVIVAIGWLCIHPS